MTAADRARRAAEYLAQLRRAGTLPAARPRSLPADLAPHSEQQAYAVQRALTQTLGARVGAWKVAMSSATQGSAAPIFAEDLYHSPAQVPCVIGDSLGLEPEVAFSVRCDLPSLPDGGHYRQAEIIDAIDAAYAAIEIVVSRFQSHDGATPLDRLADNISNAGLVLSAPCNDWRRLDFRTVPLELTLRSADGVRVQHCSRGGHPLGEPLAALLWLLNDRTHGLGGLRAGEVVTTGSYAGLHHAARGSRVSVDFAGLGAVALEVA
ncbi:MAG TPA: hypothetical protein VN757_11265 [Steroidobacteraceae bacterium]|nr:hypothetical protein [Steroidobacteraceae bacterium]